MKTKVKKVSTGLEVYYEQWTKLKIKANLSGESALEAVKQNGDALRYVKEQTEAVALEAVKQYGYALQYVNEKT